jgi:predicted DNA-binding protein
MTVVFEDEELYTALKVESARTGRHAKDIVAEAVREWLESREDEELAREVEEARTEWTQQGGVEAGEFFRELKAGPQ